MKRLLVAGSRGIEPSIDDFNHAMDLIANRYLDGSEHGTVIVVHGNARGVDKAGAFWAKAYGHPVEMFEPDWNTDGRGAEFVRNKAMVDSGLDAAIIFWDGSSKDTAHTLGLLEEAGVPRVVVIV